MDEIVRLLRDGKLRKKVVSAAKEAYENAVNIYREDEMLEYIEADKVEEFRREYENGVWDEAWWNHGYQAFATHHILQIFEEEVLAKLKKPHRITLFELVDEFIQLCGIDPDDVEEIDFDLIYSAFVNRLNNHLLRPRQSDGFPICRLPESADSDRLFWAKVQGILIALKKYNPDMELPKEQNEDERNLLWQRNGINFYVLGMGYLATDKRSSLLGLQGGPALYAEVSGPMMLSALHTVRGELERIVPSVIRSLAFLEAKAEEDTGCPEYPCPTALAQITEPSLQERKPFLQACLDAYYTDATKKDSIEKRIRNAVHLLVESDAQANDAVALSLSVTAIEALLGKGGGEIAEKLSTDTAVLLESELDRRQLAADYVKNLYKHRSDALHGASTVGEPKVRNEARHLAAAVLEQLISRRDFMARSGFGTETVDDLLKGLRETKYRTGLPVGVSETNARMLWKGQVSA